eukprot:12922722-Prorocentrum_lima.AAC.1
MALQRGMEHTLPRQLSRRTRFAGAYFLRPHRLCRVKELDQYRLQKLIAHLPCIVLLRAGQHQRRVQR